MSIPGFTVDSPATGNFDGYRGNSHHPGRGLEVRPASCYGDCMSECIADGGMSKSGCNTLCTVDCGDKPPDNPPYQCKPTDNSVNHMLCIGAQDVWGFAADEECNLMASVPLVGPALVVACKAGVARVVAEGKAGCPPKVICV